MPHPYLDPVLKAHSWLYLFEEKKTYLDSSTKVLIAKLTQAMAVRDSVRAREVLTQLHSLVSRLWNNQENAEICLCCGRYYYELDEFKEAARLMREAADRFVGWHHQCGVAYWMLGYVLWETSATMAEAIQVWRRGLGLFEKVFNGDRYNAAWGSQYLTYVNDRKTELNQFLAASAPLLPPRTWGLVVEAPGGGFGPLGAQARPVGVVNRYPLAVGGRPYQLALLSQYTEAEIEGFEGLVVYRYPGEGMDKAGIRRNDYVLLRWQEDAGDGEIVAVEFIDQGCWVKLRRLSRQGETRIFSPESGNPDLQPRDLPAASRRARLRAVVLAVLRPA